MPTAIKVKLRDFAKDVSMQECCTLRDALLEGVQCDHASEEDGRVAFRKISVGARSEKLDGGAERGRKSDNGRHPYGKGGAVKQVAEDVTEVIGLKIVRALPGGDNIIRGVIEIHR